MRLVHLSDLHLGKRLNEFSLIEDQKYILDQILSIIEAQKADVTLIAGDVYDRSTPSAEAVELLDGFMAQLVKLCPVVMVAGNHDSPQRIAFGGSIMSSSGVHLSPVYDGHAKYVDFTDQFGPLRIYLLPFIKPTMVRRFFPDSEIETYTDALSAAIGEMSPDTSLRNVLVAHQFVTGASRSESEEVSVGGLDNVDASVFDPFDYVALGHIHSPQSIGRDTLRYSGTPLKYSFSESKDEKSVTIIDMGPKGDVSISTVPLVPLRDTRQVRGDYFTLSQAMDKTSDDYIHVVLTDENEIPDAISTLRKIYPNIMKLTYDNRRSRASGYDFSSSTVTQSPLELFSELYQQQNGQPMDQVQTKYLTSLINEIWEGSL